MKTLKRSVPNNRLSDPNRRHFVQAGPNHGRVTVAARGTILIIVLLTIVILTLSGFAFMKLMSTQNQASRLMTTRIQSKYLADSGVDYVRLFLSQNDQQIFERGGLWDNNEQFIGVPVSIDLQNTQRIGMFTIIAPSINSDGIPDGVRYGLVDESSKLNINTLPYMDKWVDGGGRTLLMALPDMTEEIADAIIDWVDTDDDVREYGAESADYSSRSYLAKNGPMDSIEELLLVRGVTPQMMFGLDHNRNGKIDDVELAESDSSSLDADMLLGWANYLTLYSKESNLNSDGLTRININSPNLEQLYADLKSRFDENWSRFIVNYRMNGPYQPRDIDEIEESAAGYDIDFEQEPQFQFNQILDLIGIYTTAFDPEDLNDRAVIASPVTLEQLPFLMPVVMQNITTYDGESIPGRINIMHAPRVVLEGIPGMTEEVLETILAKREFELNDPEMTDQNRKYETWILLEGIVDLPTMRVMLPFICAGGDVYRAEIYGFFNDGIGASRAEVVLDTTVPVPRILFWRDKSYLSSGFPIEVLIDDARELDSDK